MADPREGDGVSRSPDRDGAVGPPHEAESTNHAPPPGSREERRRFLTVLAAGLAGMGLGGHGLLSEAQRRRFLRSVLGLQVRPLPIPKKPPKFVPIPKGEDGCPTAWLFSDGGHCTGGQSFKCEAAGNGQGFWCQGGWSNDFECDVEGQPFDCSTFTCEYSFDTSDCADFCCNPNNKYVDEDGGGPPGTQC